MGSRLFYCDCTYKGDARVPDSIGVKANSGYTVKSISLAMHMTKLESKRVTMSFVRTEAKGTESFLFFTIFGDHDSASPPTGEPGTISGTTFPVSSACKVNLEALTFNGRVYV